MKHSLALFAVVSLSIACTSLRDTEVTHDNREELIKKITASDLSEESRRLALHYLHRASGRLALGEFAATLPATVKQAIRRQEAFEQRLAADPSLQRRFNRTVIDQMRKANKRLENALGAED